MDIWIFAYFAQLTHLKCTSVLSVNIYTVDPLKGMVAFTFQEKITIFYGTFYVWSTLKLDVHAKITVKSYFCNSQNGLEQSFYFIEEYP